MFLRPNSDMSNRQPHESMLVIIVSCISCRQSVVFRVWDLAFRRSGLTPIAYGRQAAFWPTMVYCLSSIKLCTMEGSAKVEVSPNELKSRSAILRRIRRIILPDRVLGSAGAN